jgi:leader peptidase (prepilin peptidase) / N-methyltransferase
VPDGLLSGLSPATALVVVAWAALGFVVGLALNRLAYALPAETGPAWAPRCPACGASVPFVGGWARACRSCGAPVPYDRLEWLTALLFGILAARFGPDTSLVAYSVYTISLAITAAIDLRHRYVYSIVSMPTLLLALVLSPTLAGMDFILTLAGVGAALGVFTLFYLVGRLIYRDTEAIAKGDLEMAAMIGAMVGFPRIINALSWGVLVNGIAVALLLLTRRRGRSDFAPYGPGLCLGAFLAFFAAP